MNNRKITVDIFSNIIILIVMRNRETIEYNLNEQETTPSKAEKGQMKTGSHLSFERSSEEAHKRRAEQKDAISRIVRELARKHPDQKPEYPIAKEKAMLTAIRRGEPIEARKFLNELLALITFSNSGDIDVIKQHVMTLTVLLSRIEAAPGNHDIYTMEENHESLKRVYEAETTEELTDLSIDVMERVSNMIAAFRGSPHAAALRRAESFIAENYTRKLSLKEIAGIAGLSPPYFSTIFKDEMGENLSKYLNRLRVEKASELLLNTDMTLSEIAANCCFEDQSWFSKIFKAFTGISPGKYRNQGGGVISDLIDSNLSQAFRKAMQKSPRK